MLIIVEGCDLVGKTTFIENHLKPAIQRIDPSSKIEVLKKGPAILSAMEEYEAPLYDYRPSQRRHIICDRWHWGEAVYPHIVGRPSRMDEAEKWHIDHFLQSRGAIVLHITAQRKTLFDRYDTRGDSYIQSSQLMRVHSAFEDLYANAITYANLPAYTLHKVETVTPEFVSTLIARANASATYATRLDSFVTYVGPAKPTILLLGSTRAYEVFDDEYNPVVRDYGLHPAFQPHAPVSAGRYLISALTKYEAPWITSKIGLACANDVDDANALIDALGKPKTVALGVVAAAHTADRIVGNVAHPSHYERFKPGKEKEYVQSIMTAAARER